MKYRVTGTVTISVSVVVEATTRAEAQRLARQSPTQTLCHSCSRGDDGCWSTSGEIDGEVVIRRGGTEEA